MFSKRVLCCIAMTCVQGPTVAAVAAKSAGSQCCSSLSSLLPLKVVYPNSTAYEASLSSYWAQQEQLVTPSCVLAATAAEDISVALARVIVPQSCHFAVRGGGHGSVTGTANIQGGITIDLSGLNSTVLSDDRSSVSVGSGQRLGSLYTYLAQHGLAAAGARDYSVGVAGSTLGGGLGFLNPSTGFGCDGVVEYQVVLANGTVVHANKGENPDLFRALKGGGGNFGIVTTFVMRTFALGDIWAGDSVYPSTTSVVQAEAQAIYNFTANPQYDRRAAVMVTYHYTNGSDPIVVTEYSYTEPDISDVTVFNEFFAVPDQVLNGTGVTTLPAFSGVEDATSPKGYQEITFDLSFGNNIEMLLKAWDLFNSTIPAIQGIEGVSWSLSLEPILGFMANSGNVLGLEVPPGGLILGIGSITFSSALDYPYMSRAADQFLAELTAAARGLGILNRWIDMNHAGANQDVLAGYGPANLSFLKATAKKYDPKAVFQTLKPGGFKL